jgi:hypothetical protein
LAIKINWRHLKLYWPRKNSCRVDAPRLQISGYLTPMTN